MSIPRGFMCGFCLLALAGHAAAAGKQNYKELYRQGVEYNKQGKFAEAVSYYSRAIALKPDSADLYFVRGRAYRQSDQLDNAISDFSKAVSLRQDYAEAYNHRGVAYIGKGDMARAKADFGKACGMRLKDACANLEKLQGKK